MKIIGPIVFILIAEISRSANAQSTEQEMQSQCIRNGGPEAYENMAAGIINFKNSIQPPAREILMTYYYSGIAAALSVYCDKVENLTNALISITEAVKPCQEPEDRELLVSNNFTAAVLRFPCENRNLVEAVHNSTNRECLISKKQAMKDCGLEMISGLNATRTNPARREVACRLTQTFEQCTVRVLGECEDKIFLTSMDSLYKYSNNYLPCENLTKSPIQKASQPEIAHLL